MKIQGYPDPGDGLRLHLNENTGGCSPAVLDAIRRIRPADVSVYPSYREAVLAGARHFDVNPDWILMTNGLDEGILMAAVGHIARAGLHDAETIIPLPAFDPYPNSTAAVGATPVRVPPGRDYAFSHRRRARGDHSADAAHFPEYAEQSDGPVDRRRRPGPHRRGSTERHRADRRGLHRVRRHDVPATAVAARETFSSDEPSPRAYGLAGMRIGIVIGQPPALDAVRAVTLPFNLNGGGAGGHGRRPRGRRFSPAVRRAGARVAGAPVCRVRPPRPRVLEERRRTS